MKICSRCSVTKAVTEFAVRKASKDGLQSACKQCLNANGEKYRAAVKDNTYKTTRIKLGNDPLYYKSDRAKNYRLLRYYK